MARLPLLAVLVLAAFVSLPGAGPAASSPCFSQDGDTPLPDKRPEIKALLEELKGHTKKRGEEDDQAIAVVDRLYREFEASGPKDRQAIVKGLAACFGLKRTKELSPGEPDDRLYLACAVALGDMGPESVKPLLKLIGHKSHRRNLRLQERLIRSVGKTRDEAAVGVLIDLLKHHEPRLQAAGAAALGQFADKGEKVRKKIFAEIVRGLMDQKARIDADTLDQEAADRWNTISGPFVETLQRLSGQDIRVPEQWQRWWNKNKKRKWDEGG